MQPLRIFPPIPQQPAPFTEKIKIIPVDEPLIDLYEQYGDVFAYEPAYWNQGIKGATPLCLVRKQVGKRLVQASRLLPKGCKFKIFDSWRSYEVQKVLYDQFVQKLRVQHPSLPEEQLYMLVNQFVSFPSRDKNTPFVHSTGGAVDLTIVDAADNEKNMGSLFDDYTQLSFTGYFELHRHGAYEIIHNRRLLFYCMYSAGFTNLPSEWWHYDFGTVFWAYYHKTHSFYDGISKPSPTLK